MSNPYEPPRASEPRQAADKSTSMQWWKVGVYASFAWVLILVVLAGGMIWYISSHPMGGHRDDARMESAGEATGMLLAAGIALIWFYAIGRLKKRSSRSNRDEPA
jgi:hypothetical protein